MAVPVLACSRNIDNVIRRPAVNYSPSIWGDQFLSSTTHHIHSNMETYDKAKYLGIKEKVRRMLMDAAKNPLHNLDLIDAVLRLGVSYHFEAEIDDVMQQLYLHHHNHLVLDTTTTSDDIDDQLYSVSLLFRLLRQQGYTLSTDVFKRFMDSKGKFKESLTSNVKGMLSLYEAAHLRMHGEEILDEALCFTTTHLQSLIDNPQIVDALTRPIHRNLPRVEARRYMSIYEQDLTCNKDLLTFAKLDFNILQNLYRKELCGITRWWKDLGLSKKLSFARDRVVECYFWSLGMYFEPQYAFGRRILTKVIAMTSIIDDIYDTYATPQELELFTLAIERWEISAMDQLPEYMKVCYVALLDIFKELEEELVHQGRPHHFYYAKEAMKKQTRYYFLESKWLNQKYTPKVEEYMEIAQVTCGYPMIITISLVAMGDDQNFDWSFNNSTKIMKACTTICRLMDDIVSHEFEQERGHVASSVECYMKQHGATREEAINEFRKQIGDAWKDMNEEYVRPTLVTVARPILIQVLNLVRFMDLVYKDGDGYTNVEFVLKHIITSQLITPIPI